jgi:hypothetical protein
MTQETPGSAAFLRNLFGVPEEGSLETRCRLGGPLGCEIIKDRDKTGYFIAGQNRDVLMNWEGRIIAYVSGGIVPNILTPKGELTGYWIGGPLGHQILYSENFRR